MRRRISWLVMATTSTVVVSFVIPLCLLVRNLAEERAMAAADQEARNVAIVVAALSGKPGQLRDFFSTLEGRSGPQTSLLTADGQTLGLGVAAGEDLAEDPEVKRAASKGVSFRKVDDNGGRVLIPVIVETRKGDVGTAVVRSSVSAADLHQGVIQAWAGIIGLGLGLLFLAMVMASRLGRRVSAPLRQVAGAAHEMREGNLLARAKVTGTEETQELARALNGLAERTGELLAAERAAVGDLSHRLRTPVTALRLDAEAVPDPELAGRLQEHIATLQVTIDAIVAEARRPVRADLRETCDAAQAVRQRVAFWQVLAEDQQRVMRVSVPAEALLVPVAENDLTDVVDVLIDNVFGHTPDGTPFDVTLVADSGWVFLVVADLGPGIDLAGRTDRPGSTGLGLDIVRRLAVGCGGDLRIAPGSDTAAGTRVEVVLPLVER